MKAATNDSVYSWFKTQKDTVSERKLSKLQGDVVRLYSDIVIQDDFFIEQNRIVSSHLLFL